MPGKAFATCTIKTNKKFRLNTRKIGFKPILKGQLDYPQQKTFLILHLKSIE